MGAIENPAIQGLGWFILYIWTPLHVITCAWLYYRRRYFPIVGRYPMMTVSMMMFETGPMLYVGALLNRPSQKTPCWIAWYIFTPSTIAFIPVIVIRATLLLCQFEIQSDLATAEKIRAAAREKYRQINKERAAAFGNQPADEYHIGAPSGTHSMNTGMMYKVTSNQYRHHASSAAAAASSSSGASLGSSSRSKSSQATQWKPSWFTRNRLAMRGKYLWRMIGLFVACHIIVDLTTLHMVVDAPIDVACPYSPQLWLFRTILSTFDLAIHAPLIIWLFVVVWNLRRHSVDAYGLLNEFRWSVFGLCIFPLGIGYSQQYTSLNQPLSATYILIAEWVPYVITWLSTCVWPLILSYTHQRRMAHRLAAITRVTRLSELLVTQDGYESFLAFTKKEFASEGVLFWKRIADFRESSVLQQHQQATANNDTNGENDTKTNGATVPATTAAPITVPLPMLSDNSNKNGTGNGNHDSNGDSKAPSVAKNVATNAVSLGLSSHSSKHRTMLSDHLGSGNGSTNPPHPLSINTTGNTGGGAPLSAERAQLHLLASLVEANQIWAYYIDLGSPNELNLSSAIRIQVRSALDNLLVRAATANNLYINPTTITANNGNGNGNANIASGMRRASQQKSLGPRLGLTSSAADAASSAGSSNQLLGVNHLNNVNHRDTGSPINVTTPHGNGNGNGGAGNGNGDTTNPISMEDGASALPSPNSGARPPTLMIHNSTTITSGTGTGATVNIGMGSFRGLVQQPNCTLLPPRLLTRRGVSVSTGLTVEQCHSLEMEVRSLFNQCQEIIINLLHIHHFQRYLASDAWANVIAALKGFTPNGQVITGVNVTPTSPDRQLITRGDDAAITISPPLQQPHVIAITAPAVVGGAATVVPFAVNDADDGMIRSDEKKITAGLMVTTSGIGSGRDHRHVAFLPNPDNTNITPKSYGPIGGDGGDDGTATSVQPNPSSVNHIAATSRISTDSIATAGGGTTRAKGSTQQPQQPQPQPPSSIPENAHANDPRAVDNNNDEDGKDEEGDDHVDSHLLPPHLRDHPHPHPHTSHHGSLNHTSSHGGGGAGSSNNGHITNRSSVMSPLGSGVSASGGSSLMTSPSIEHQHLYQPHHQYGDLDINGKYRPPLQLYGDDHSVVSTAPPPQPQPPQRQPMMQRSTLPPSQPQPSLAPPTKSAPIPSVIAARIHGNGHGVMEPSSSAEPEASVSATVIYQPFPHRTSDGHHREPSTSERTGAPSTFPLTLLRAADKVLASLRDGDQHPQPRHTPSPTLPPLRVAAPLPSRLVGKGRPPGGGLHGINITNAPPQSSTVSIPLAAMPSSAAVSQPRLP